MKSKVSKSEQIRNLYDAGKSSGDIRKQLNCSSVLVSVVLRNYKKKLKKEKDAEKLYRNFHARRSNIIKTVTETKQALDAIEKKPKVHKSLDGKVAWIEIPDLVNHPPHYKAGGFETIDFIEAKDLNYRLGNVVKYVSRAGKKGDPLQDLEKAAWYLQREIAARKNA